MDIDELKKSFQNYLSNNSYLEAFILVYSEYISRNENKDDTVALVFIYNGYLQILLPITLIFSKLLLIYDKYLDYLPIEKMPKNFPNGDKSSAKDKKSDIVDDLLFIDDMDE